MDGAKEIKWFPKKRFAFVVFHRGMQRIQTVYQEIEQTISLLANPP